jgi:exo-beta-1,3-glucanase (GH17 family)
MSQPCLFPDSKRLWLLAGAYLAIAAATLIFLGWTGRAVAVAEVPGGKVQCLSYTPPDGNPAKGTVASPARIRADLEHLAQYTHCVRTYSVSHGLDYVPEVARALGLKVMLGIWIGMDARQNELEIARALELARTHRDTIDSLIVGNEVLLRREQTPAALRTYIQRVRAATDVPVTYADVWEYWLRYEQLAPEVSFVTVHMLPYWEDEPVRIERAVAHIAEVLERVQQAFQGKRVVIGEAGWPSMGRQRDGAVPSLVNEARFFREFTAYAAKHDVHYNFIEAFDQPWKRALEGTVGGQWGLFDAQSRLKFPLQGPVQEDPDWRVPFVAALAAAVLVAVLAGWLWRAKMAWRAAAIAGLASCSAAALLVLQVRYLAAANRTPIEWLGSVTWFLSGWLVYVCSTWLIVRSMRDACAVASLPSALHTLRCFDSSWRGAERVRAMLSLSRLVFLFGLAYIGILLTLDSRYRDFPVMAAVLPVAALWMYSLVNRPNVAIERPLEELLLTYWLAVASVWIALAEGWENVQAMLWCGLNLWVALTVIWEDRQARYTERTEEQPERGELNPI